MCVFCFCSKARMQKGRKSLKDEIASLVSETVQNRETPDPDAEGYEDGPRVDSDFDEEFVDDDEC